MEKNQQRAQEDKMHSLLRHKNLDVTGEKQQRDCNEVERSRKGHWEKSSLQLTKAAEWKVSIKGHMFSKKETCFFLFFLLIYLEEDKLPPDQHSWLGRMESCAGESVYEAYERAEERSSSPEGIKIFMS